MDNLTCMDLCCCTVLEAKQYLGEQVCVYVCACVCVTWEGVMCSYVNGPITLQCVKRKCETLM